MDQKTESSLSRRPERPRAGRFPMRLALPSLAGQYVMAVTGVALMIFVLAHMAGNLLIFAGRDALNSYAHSLEAHPGLLWLARALLIVIFVAHFFAGSLLALKNRAARPIPYVFWKPAQCSWSARHMFLTGVLVLAFVVYHLLHFSFGVTDPSNFKYAIPTDPHGHYDVAGMVVGGFSQTPIVIAYVAAQVILGLHLSHGAWSWCQHLNLNRENPLKPWSWFPPSGSGRRGYARLVHWFGALVTTVVVIGNCSIPLAIRLGWRPAGLAGPVQVFRTVDEPRTVP
ncbi:MAG TPA: succinate dehydrogenase cytochrome b subunit [Gemmataceae bacterium]|nr:succinate dehydrogenase cytochrome b subunit [Gemmataceae bacterium]